MIYGNTSAGVVLAKIFRDFKVDNSDWTLDAIEWIGEALEFIGSVNQYKRKAVILEVSDHCAVLPGDLILLQGIFYSTETDITKFIAARKAPLYSSTSSTLHAGVHSSVANEGTFPDNGDKNYVINDNAIYTSFEKGLIAVSYLAIPLGEDGYPMIPDHISFKEALKWFIAMRLMEGGWTHSIFTFEKVEFNWRKYCTQARNHAAMLDLPQMQNFMRNWVQLARINDRFDAGFNDTPLTLAGVYGSSLIAQNKVA